MNNNAPVSLKIQSQTAEEKRKGKAEKKREIKLKNFCFDDGLV